MTNHQAVEFLIPGQPVAKGRPKFARRGNFTATYTPERTVNYETLVKLAAAEAMAGNVPLAGPVHLRMVISLQIPQSWSKKRQAMAEAGQIAATKKPDADNVLKAVKDGMNGIVYCDDAQAVELVVVKRYSTVPSVLVVVTPIDAEAA